MKKYRLLTAITLSVTLAMSSVAYGEPVPGEAEVQIDATGPAQDLEENEENSPAEESQTGQSQSQGTFSGTAGETDGQAASGTVSSGAENVSQPTIQSEGAVLLDASTGTVLFGKNENTQFYPASITKLMTGLLVVENCSLDDTVTFSKTATTNLESGSVTLNLTEGDELSVQDCLYALLLKSANEVANGLAEKVSGSVSTFAEKMNAKAAELGCTNTHFVNPNGLNDTQHYTTPYDMALIARAAFANETLQKIDSTTTYKIPATKLVSTERTITMGHKMFYTTDSRYYSGIIGGKTGYTSKAGNTLVTGVERDGVRLIAVVMKSKGTHYQDTKALLDYGFANRNQLVTGGQSAVSPDGQTGPTAGSDSQNGSLQTTGTETVTGTGTTTETETASETETAGNDSSETVAGAWALDGTKRYYIKTDGTRAASEWLKIGSHEYWFDADGTMAVGWRNFTNGDWYYFDTDGKMVTDRWVESVGQMFYLGSNGVMMKNTTTPDGYTVDENGARK